MSASRFVSPLFFWPDSTGTPLPNARLFFFFSGTDENATTYTDAALTIPSQNPVPSDGAGQWPAIFLDPATIYKVKLEDENGAEVWTEDPVSAPIVSAPVILTVTGTPGNAQWLGGEEISQAINFAANFAGSGGVFPKTAPTGVLTISIQRNGFQIGTASCSPTSDWTFLGSAVGFLAGDVLDFFNQGVADATAADFGLTLAGILA